MAVLRRVAAIPSQDEVRRYERLHSGFDVYFPSLVRGATVQKVKLSPHDGSSSIIIGSDYFDIAFKFEGFTLTTRGRSWDQEEGPVAHRIAAPGLDGIFVLLTATWERPARLGEVPSHYDAVVQESGQLGDVPPESPACYAMIGLSFADSAGTPRLTIELDQDDPLTVNVRAGASSYPTNKINRVDLSEVARLAEELRDWDVPEEDRVAEQNQGPL